MKKTYEPMEMEVISLRAEDVIMTSGCENELPEDE
jgi:hypothetical protein